MFVSLQVEGTLSTLISHTHKIETTRQSWEWTVSHGLHTDLTDQFIYQTEGLRSIMD